MGVSGGPPSSVVAPFRGRTPRGAAVWEGKGRAEPQGCALGRRVSWMQSGRGGEGCQGVCGLQAALGAGPASSLPQVRDVGGPGDLMETKVKENANFRESCGSHEGPGKTGGCFVERFRSHRGFTLGFLFLFLFFLAWFHHVIEDAME